MAFDLARAVQESLPGRSPFLDRLLSYLYFADVGAFEQTTWDDHGGGISVIGVKGHESAPGILLAGPLPADGPLDASSPTALARAVDLLARVWALSELDGASLPVPVFLVAYRPDPVGAALSAILDGNPIPAFAAVASAPVGAVPVTELDGCALIHARLQGAPRPFRPARDIVVARASGGSPADALRALAGAVRAGQAAPLGGVSWGLDDVGGEMPLELTLALADSDRPPPGWVVVSRPEEVGPGGAWAASTTAASDLLEALAKAADAPVRLAALELGPTSTLDAVVDLPPGPVVAGIDAALDAVLSRPEASWSGFVVRHAPGVPGPRPRVVSGVASLLTHWVPRVVALGPDPAACRDAPVETAVTLAAAYLGVLRDLLPRRRSAAARRNP